MGRYKHIDFSARLMALDLERQLLPVTFEHALHHMIGSELDLSHFDARLRNDLVGASAYPPAMLLKVVLFGYSRALASSLRLSMSLGPLGCVQLAWSQPCPPDGFTRQTLLELEAAQFATLAPAQREPLVLGLLACLGNADPVLRDDIAFESLSTLMRSQRVSRETATTILQRLQPQLAADFGDPDGFIKPFAALTLAEVVRMDRIDRFLTEPQWSSLLQSATGYLVSVRDYRGFDAKEGWRHGVAHGVDLLMQISLNPRAVKADLDGLLAAIAAQVVPAAGHYYVHGESMRLARPVFYVAQRGLHSEQEWTTWLQAVTRPVPLPAWSEAFKSENGLAKRHNTVSFLTALYVLLQENGSPAARERMLEPLQAALAAVPWIFREERLNGGSRKMLCIFISAGRRRAAAHRQSTAVAPSLR